MNLISNCYWLIDTLLFRDSSERKYWVGSGENNREKRLGEQQLIPGDVVSLQEKTELGSITDKSGIDDCQLEENNQVNKNEMERHTCTL